MHITYYLKAVSAEHRRKGGSPVFEAHFGFSQTPFRKNLPHLALFPSQGHQELVASLRYAIERAAGGYGSRLYPQIIWASQLDHLWISQPEQPWAKESWKTGGKERGR
jgi:hypothetical protein